MRFTFPAYKKIPQTKEEFRIQLEYVKGEIEEALEALEEDGELSIEFIMELMDITHANETSLRAFNHERLNYAREQVYLKNRVRDYYG